MSGPRLSEINLNLLVSLDALLTERSVSRAARRTGVSQPAMSQSLRQLRAIFDDALLARDRGVLVLTPAAERLMVPLRHALVAVQRVLDGEKPFDPGRAERRFTIAVGDFAAVTLLPPLLERASREAPGIGFDVRPVEPTRLFERLATGEFDLVIGAKLDASGDFMRQLLYRDGFVCMARRDHPELSGDALDLERYAALPHVLISPTGEGPSVVDRLLAERGKQRRIALRIPYFLAAPLMVVRSDLVLTAPRSVAGAFASTHALALFEPPLELPSFGVYQLWHQRYQSDDAHRWLRELVAASSPAPAG